MTREKAIQINHLLCKVEAYEALRDEITGLQTVEELQQAFGDTTIEDELLAVVETRLYKLTKELEEM